MVWRRSQSPYKPAQPCASGDITINYEDGGSSNHHVAKVDEPEE